MGCAHVTYPTLIFNRNLRRILGLLTAIYCFRQFGPARLNSQVPDASRVEFHPPTSHESAHDDSTPIDPETFLKKLLSSFGDRSPATSVFYNVFVPYDEKGMENSLRIVKEQIMQIKTSYAASANDTIVPVVIITIGRENVMTQQRLSQMCPSPLDCRLAAHHTRGTEAITLQYLTDFCRLAEATNKPDQIVTYLHNKGSFHANDKNEFWRHTMTTAVVSHLCLQHLQQNSCNVCGMQFYMLWAHFFPGNMWSSRCSYVSKLLDTEYFLERLTKVVGEALVMRIKNEIVTTRFPSRMNLADKFGLLRYAMEHWVGSHPDFVPCDVGPDHFYMYQRNRTMLSQLEWSLAPREPRFRVPVIDSDKRNAAILQERRDVRIREYFNMAGQLLRWNGLYGKVPENTSWVWKHYDDGDFWREAVRAHGANAVAAVTSEWAIEKGWYSFSEKEIIHAEGMFSHFSTINHGVFYRVFIPDGLNETQIESKALVVHQQLDALGASFTKRKKATVFINTMGDTAVDALTICRSKAFLDCRDITYSGAKLYEGETLQKLYLFCKRHPRIGVTYMSNQLLHPPKDIDDERNLIVAMTQAAVDPVCLIPHKVDRNLTCNLCGLAFHTLPFLHMSGNTWTVPTCEYINKLIPPVQFAEKMHHFLREALPMRITGALNSHLTSDGMDVLGVDAYAMEHWVGSHPSLIPCDLSPFPSEMRQHKRHADASSFNIRDASKWRNNKTVDFQIDSEQLSKVLKSDQLRIREYTFLAGNIIKWQLLYGTLPSTNSWVFDAFPDGERWRDGIMRVGGREIVEKFAEATGQLTV
ncbi:hypothetical protein MPSEU_000833000 [Mayamaea pseudoterrestris]|nr:hypothetical protein MPSEU_000833000 [Mayamaea pseudoterrestris]